MEEALRAGEQKFRTLTENSPAVIVRYDRDCRRLYVNPAFEYATEIGVRGEPHAEEKTGWWRSNIPREKYLARLRRVMATGKPVDFTLEWRRLDTGRVTMHPVRVIAERNPEGEIIGCLAIGHDITALMEAELRLTKLAEISPGVMFNLLLKADGTCCIPYISPRIEELSGHHVEKITADMTVFKSRVHHDDVGGIEKSVAVSARTLLPWHAEFRMHHPERGDVWVEGHATPETQPDGHSRDPQGRNGTRPVTRQAFHRKYGRGSTDHEQ